MLLDRVDVNFEFVRTIREYELQEVLQHLPIPAGAGRLLELGAGSGWQSQRLSQLGWAVTALDIEESVYLEQTVFPVQTYDGHRIPCADSYFDCVFTSNVLEHVTHLEQLLTEVYRVLKPGGLAIHVLPTPSWRIYTSAMHYLAIAKLALSTLARGVMLRSSRLDQIATIRQSASITELFRKALHSGRHGEHGSEATEVYYFSRFRWHREFRTAGFGNITRCPMSLAYSGYSVFGTYLPMAIRKVITMCTGASCQVFIMHRPKRSDREVRP